MVHTARLQISPLDHSGLAQYLQAGDLFEVAHGLLKTGRTMDAGVRRRLEKFTLSAIEAAQGDQALFTTLWIVVHGESREIVAELGFKGAPGKAGEIEIGYGTLPAHRGRGYMTEAIGGMLRWAATRPDVQTVLAETDQQNAASIRVVQKNGFEQFAKKGEMLWWRKDV